MKLPHENKKKQQIAALKNQWLCLILIFGYFFSTRHYLFAIYSLTMNLQITRFHWHIGTLAYWHIIQFFLPLPIQR